MSRSVTSHRVYGELADFWRMVSRSAYTQLRYSLALLLLATAAMLIAMLSPVFGVTVSLGLTPSGLAAVAGLSWLAMSAAYWPTVRFYRLPAAWSLTLPLAAALFLAMTWGSAVSYWRGTRATWKNRSYEKVH